ncbi:MAG: SDR family oxidoreductase [Devosia sp.]
MTLAENPRVLITGGAAGIGWAMAQLFAERGCRVAIADMDIEMANARALQLGLPHRAIKCDVTDDSDVLDAAEAMVEYFGGCDMLINNAGCGDTSKPSIEQETAHFRKMLDVNLTGSFVMSREIAKLMIAQGDGGAIVNFASIAGLTGLPKRNGYGAAKAGLISLTRSLACEWAAAGIRVNAVAPGYVETDLVRKLADDGLLDLDAISRRSPMGRMIQPREVAEAVYFLSSRAASAITGTVLSVDAGWHAFGAAGDASTTSMENN